MQLLKRAIHRGTSLQKRRPALSPRRPIRISKIKNSNQFSGKRNFATKTLDAVDISIWKNNSAFVTQQFSLPRKLTRHEILAPDDVLQGTLWAESMSPKLTLESIRSTTSTFYEDVTCTSLTELVEANINHVVELQIGTAWIVGRVHTIQGSGKGLLFLETERGALLVPMADIKAFRLPSYAPPELQVVESQQQVNTRIRKPLKDEMLRISYQYNDSEGNKDEMIRLGFGVHGISWSPTYRLDLSADNSSARLRLSSTIQNRRSEIKAQTLRCRFGAPYPHFGKILDPLVESFNRKLDLTENGIEDEKFTFPEPQEYVFHDVNIKTNSASLLFVFDTQLQYRELFVYSPLVSPRVQHQLQLLELPHTCTAGPVTIMKNQIPWAFSTLSGCVSGSNCIIPISEVQDVSVVQNSAEKLYSVRNSKLQPVLLSLPEISSSLFSVPPNSSISIPIQ